MSWSLDGSCFSVVYDLEGRGTQQDAKRIAIEKVDEYYRLTEELMARRGIFDTLRRVKGQWEVPPEVLEEFNISATVIAWGN